MVNLEWLRTFRMVYRTKSLSRAAELLHISQPTVSQQIRTLEAHLGQKLFTRKSKGVIETDEGRVLNTMVAGSLETLEEVECQITQQDSKLRAILTIGISSHLFKTMLGQEMLELGDYVHVQFGTKQQLITQVEQGKLLYAIIPDSVNTFDIICEPLFDQKLILVSTPDIDLSSLADLYTTDLNGAEQLLTDQTWYAHDTFSGYIKFFWMANFNKKRPAVVANYVIPDEYETLSQLTNGSGLSVALDHVAAQFVKEGLLKTWAIPAVPFRQMSLIANKKKATPATTESIKKLILRRHD